MADGECGGGGRAGPRVRVEEAGGVAESASPAVVDRFPRLLDAEPRAAALAEGGWWGSGAGWIWGWGLGDGAFVGGFASPAWRGGEPRRR